MKTIKELIPLIENWAQEKGLNNPSKQYLKLLEEVGESAHEILHEDWDKAKLEFGDIAVTAIVLGKQLGRSLNFYHRTSLSDSFNFNWILTEVDEDSIDNDFLIYLSDLCKFYKLDLTECLNLAWEKIKNRKGETKNGTFIKEK